MPGRKVKKVHYAGREVEVTVIPVVADQEYWNSYTLDDGSIVRIKLIAQEVLRVNRAYDEDGEPVYIIRSTNVTSTDAADNLLRHNQPPESEEQRETEEETA